MSSFDAVIQWMRKISKMCLFMGNYLDIRLSNLGHFTICPGIDVIVVICSLLLAVCLVQPDVKIVI